LRRSKRSIPAWAAALALVGAGCSGGDETRSAPGPAPAGDPAAASPGAPTTIASNGDAAKGAEIYANVCTACHGGSPSAAGSAGPAIAGSSYELLEAKVLRGEYPPGYTPKRGSAAMPPLPYLKDHIGDLAAFLQAGQDG